MTVALFSRQFYSSIMLLLTMDGIGGADSSDHRYNKGLFYYIYASDIKYSINLNDILIFRKEMQNAIRW